MGKFTDALNKAKPAQGPQSSGAVIGGSADDRPAPPPPSDRQQPQPHLGATSRDRWDQRLFLTTEPSSPVAERFRRLRGTILHPASGKRPQTIMITSLVPHEGKGFVCANLGYALAEEMEHHALMVDCDFRRPTLARMFGVSNQTGLVDHLQNNVDLSQLIRKTGQAKLSLLPSGLPPHNPAELLTSTKILALIDELAQRYQDRIILFDSSPTVVASETNILAKRVDGVILVVRWGASSRDLVKRFAQSIGRDKILGVVFNAYQESKVDNALHKNATYDYPNYYQ